MDKQVTFRRFGDGAETVDDVSQRDTVDSVLKRILPELDYDPSGLYTLRHKATDETIQGSIYKQVEDLDTVMVIPDLVGGQ